MHSRFRDFAIQNLEWELERQGEPTASHRSWHPTSALHTMATASPTLSDTVDKETLKGYVTAALTEPDCGTPYQDSSVTVQRNTALNYFDRLLAKSNGDSITYDSFLLPQSVQNVCDGKTLYTRRTGNRNASSESYGQTAGWGSIEPLCKTLMRMMKLFGIKDDARNAAFETLIAQARKHCEAKQHEQKVPAYEDIVEQATTYIGNCDTSNLLALSEATAVALHAVVRWRSRIPRNVHRGPQQAAAHQLPPFESRLARQLQSRLRPTDGLRQVVCR